MGAQVIAAGFDTTFRGPYAVKTTGNNKVLLSRAVGTQQVSHSVEWGDIPYPFEDLTTNKGTMAVGATRLRISNSINAKDAAWIVKNTAFMGDVGPQAEYRYDRITREKEDVTGVLGSNGYTLNYNFPSIPTDLDTTKHDVRDYTLATTADITAENVGFILTDFTLDE